MPSAHSRISSQSRRSRYSGGALFAIERAMPAASAGKLPPKTWWSRTPRRSASAIVPCGSDQPGLSLAGSPTGPELNTQNGRASSARRGGAGTGAPRGATASCRRRCRGRPRRRARGSRRRRRRCRRPAGRSGSGSGRRQRRSRRSNRAWRRRRRGLWSCRQPAARPCRRQSPKPRDVCGKPASTSRVVPDGKWRHPTYGALTMTRSRALPAPPLRVLVAGGGVAALEAVLALHALAGERVSIELLAPGGDFVARPSSVLSPFTGKPAPRVPLERLRELGIVRHRGALAAVDVQGHTSARRTAGALAMTAWSSPRARGRSMACLARPRSAAR